MATDTLASPAILRYNPTKVFKNFIDGEWVESSTGETFEDRNPADTRDVVGIFQKSAKADVDAAVEAAKRAFAKWRLVPAPRRAEIVFRAAEILIERKEEYAREMTREMGKVLAETRGDVQEAIDAAYYNAGEGRRLFGPTVPSEMPNKFAMAVRQPVGVCGMITPWNFPMAISSWKLLPAIVCGNTCVIKPAQDTPLSTFNLVRALTDAGLPKGVINVVAGFGADVGTPLAEHADVRAISLTGSSAVGRIIGGIAAKSFKHCSLELGGKNPMIVLDDANLDLAIEGEVEVGVVEHDHGILATEFERAMLETFCGDAADDAAHGGRSGERDGTHVGVLGQRRADFRAESADDVDDALGQARVGEGAHEIEGGERRILRGLDDAGVAADDRGQ